MKILKNSNGFSLIELMIASGISLILIALLAGVVKYQSNSFVLQNQLNKMQANGRGAMEIIARAVQNAGYNVFRGTRFLAASDHYISTVFDEDNDGTIQNNEVITFALGNSIGSPIEIFSIKAYFDMDEDGQVDSSEWDNYQIPMVLNAPPYNIYKIHPNNSETKHLLARNIDNLVIRYYDKNNNPLPSTADWDLNGEAILPYDFSEVPEELNDIRKVDIQILARTKDPDPRETALNSGHYIAGSVAERAVGPTYSDRYKRLAFTANQSPRNLVMTPWGKMDVVANPLAVYCPNSSTTVTATMLDNMGDPVPVGTQINFVASGGGTVDPVVNTTNSSGEATTIVSYDWTEPNESITVSANSLINVSGKDHPVFNASSANFQSGTGTFTDFFNGGIAPSWEELDNPGDIIEFDQDGDTVVDSFKMFSTDAITRAVNGCNWKNYQVEFELNLSDHLTNDGFVGGFIRYVDQNNQYRFLVERQSTGNCIGNDQKDYCLKIIHWNGLGTTLGSVGIEFLPGVNYKLLAQADGETIRAKIWDSDTLGLGDPTPNNWTVEVQNSEITGGKIGFVGSWNNSESVTFDNIYVSTL